eukprot:scaffold32237_cov96-Isochrysis_galbana.AAC.2
MPPRLSPGGATRMGSASSRQRRRWSASIGWLSCSRTRCASTTLDHAPHSQPARMRCTAAVHSGCETAESRPRQRGSACTGRGTGSTSQASRSIIKRASSAACRNEWWAGTYAALAELQLPQRQHEDAAAKGRPLGPVLSRVRVRVEARAAVEPRALGQAQCGQQALPHGRLGAFVALDRLGGADASDDDVLVAIGKV